MGSFLPLGAKITFMRQCPLAALERAFDAAERAIKRVEGVTIDITAGVAVAGWISASVARGALDGLHDRYKALIGGQ